VILRLADLVEHRLVTDARTDGHRAMASTADTYHRALKTGMLRVSVNSPRICGLSPDEEKEGYGGKDLQKREVLSTE